MDDAALLSLAAGLAEQAGAEIRAIRQRGFEIQRKADHSVVTEADHAAEAIILAGLRNALPGCTVIAEEEAAAGRTTIATAEFWLVDPLDGTREFTGGGDDFAVNIGLVRNGRPVLGVVGVPHIIEVAHKRPRDDDERHHGRDDARIGIGRGIMVRQHHEQHGKRDVIVMRRSLLGGLAPFRVGDLAGQQRRHGFALVRHDD